jgi:hypothetical protein
MKSSFHNLIPFFPSLLKYLLLPSQKTLSIISQLALDRRYIASHPTGNTFSVIIAQQFLDCCLLIFCRGNLFTESLPRNERLLWLCYSGFQESCPNINAWCYLWKFLCNPFLDMTHISFFQVFVTYELRYISYTGFWEKCVCFILYVKDFSCLSRLVTLYDDV